MNNQLSRDGSSFAALQSDRKENYRPPDNYVQWAERKKRGLLRLARVFPGSIEGDDKETVIRVFRGQGYVYGGAVILDRSGDESEAYEYLLLFCNSSSYAEAQSCV